MITHFSRFVHPVFGNAYKNFPKFNPISIHFDRLETFSSNISHNRVIFSTICPKTVGANCVRPHPHPNSLRRGEHCSPATSRNRAAQKPRPTQNHVILSGAAGEIGASPKISCHCEPVRTLAWQSPHSAIRKPPQELPPTPKIFHKSQPILPSKIQKLRNPRSVFPPNPPVFSRSYDRIS